MKRMKNKWISMLIAVSMLISLMTPLTAYAAVQLIIQNFIYVDHDQPGPSDNVNRFTLNPINFSVLINGIDQDKVVDVFYEIYNVNTGKTDRVLTNKAVKNPSNANEITFYNVTLPDGLNKITVKYGTTSEIESVPAWAYFNSVTTITDLKVNNTIDFNDNQFYPKGPPYDNMKITGTANNATRLTSTVNGNVYDPTTPLSRGNFMYLTNTGRVTDLTFPAGDNEMKFIAQNGTNYYEVKKPFVYDNGKAFAYNAFVRHSQEAADKDQKLITVPNVSNSSSLAGSGIKVSANLKNSLSVISGVTVSDYVYVDIFTLGNEGNYSVRVNLDRSTSDITHPTLTVYDSTGGTITPALVAPSVSYDSASSTSAYDILNFTADLPTNNNYKRQQVIFRFKKAGTTGEYTETRHSFDFVDVNQSYVSKVSRIFKDDPVPGNMITAQLNENGATQINEIPTGLFIETNSNTAQVKVKLNGSDYDDGTGLGSGLYAVTALDANTSYAKVHLKNVKDGNARLEVIPYTDATPATPTVNNAGKKTYDLVISGTPYVIFNNIYTGMVVRKAENLGCIAGAADGPCLTGRLVNLPIEEFKNVQLRINGSQVTVKDASNSPVNVFDPSASPLTIKTNPASPDFGTFTLPATALASSFAKDGKYTIEFTIFIGGVPVSKSSFDIFILSDDVPSIEFFRPVEEIGKPVKFTPSSNVDSYVTTEASIQLEGSVFNADFNYESSPGVNKPQIVLAYLKPSDSKFTDLDYNGSNYNAVIVTPTPPLGANPTPPYKETFSTKLDRPNGGLTVPVLPLDEYGEYTFRLTAQNNTGITAIKTIKILRQPSPYSIVEPKNTFKNEDNAFQANINANFQKIVVRADKASSVLFGKTAATLRKGPANEDLFEYEVENLKAGKNEVKFTVVRDNAKVNGSIILYNLDLPITGSLFKTDMKNSITAFGGDVKLTFQRDTKLMRNDRKTTNQFLNVQRQFLFAIASNDDGLVDPGIEDGSLSRTSRDYFTTTTSDRYRPASKRFWIDAGTIKTTDTLVQANQGSGVFPLLDTSSSFFRRQYEDLVVPSKRATLTLQYDPSIKDDAWRYVTVFQLNTMKDFTGGTRAVPVWRNIGGVVDPKKNTITVPIDSFGYFQVMFMNDSFSDINREELVWAINDIDTLFSKGIMFNKELSFFKPDDPVSRGEFASLLVSAFDIPLENLDTGYSTTDQNDPNYRGTFRDVRRGFDIPEASGLYDFMHIEAAARVGIVRGNAQGLFLPADPIRRDHASLMIARAAELKMESDAAKATASLSKKFVDAADVDKVAVGAVDAVVKAGFMEGKQNVLLPGQKNATYRFDPSLNMSRAEAAVIIRRVLQHLKKVPK